MKYCEEKDYYLSSLQESERDCRDGSSTRPRHTNHSNFTVRKYLTEREVETLMDCARKRSRYGHRDATMILMAYRHGLRASEVCGLEWHQMFDK